MKEKKLPVIATTMEGLGVCLANSVRVIYIDATLYSKFHSRIHKLLCESKFIFSHKGKRGLFYVKAEGENAFDPCKHEIYDPMGIL